LSGEATIIFSSDELRQIAFDYAGDGMFVHELMDGGRPGTFIEVNDYGCRMSGYSREELLDLTPMDIDKMPPEAARETMESLAKNSQVTFESTLVTKKGNEIPIEISNYVVSKEKKNIIVAIVRDISERKKNEEMLRDSHQRFTTVLDSLHSYVYVTTMDTYELLFVNKPIVEQFGDIVGRKCWKIFHTDKSGPCEDCPSKVLLDVNGNPAGEVMREDFNEQFGRWYELCDRAIRWVDGSIVRMGLVSDITGNTPSGKKQHGDNFRPAPASG
jgi:PAS domain S-box-containing protein